MLELRRHLGHHQPTCIQTEVGKRPGWGRHGVLVAEQDPRLTWPERELIRQLGVKPYGVPSEAG